MKAISAVFCRFSLRSLECEWLYSWPAKLCSLNNYFLFHREGKKEKKKGERAECGESAECRQRALPQKYNNVGALFDPGATAPVQRVGKQRGSGCQLLLCCGATSFSLSPSARPWLLTRGPSGFHRCGSGCSMRGDLGLPLSALFV